jgi:hypothetical protein
MLVGALSMKGMAIDNDKCIKIFARNSKKNIQRKHEAAVA